MTSDSLIRRFYDCFNERRFTDARGLFADEATFEAMPWEEPLRGPGGFVQFAERWCTAFPDAHMMVARVEQRGVSMCEVDLTATGTHLGVFELGAYKFKPTLTPVSLRLRQLFEVHDGRITLSSLSFDLHSFVSQLTTVDFSAVETHLSAMNRLREELVGAGDELGRRAVADRLVVEIDALRKALRPPTVR